MKVKELKERRIGYVCDWCGKEYKSNYVEGYGYHYEKQNEFEINYTKGEHHLPNGGGWGETKTFDLCFECREKFIKMCEEKGINVRTKKWDW